LQQPIDGGRTNPQQLFFGARLQAQLAKLLKLGDQLRHDGHQSFAANVIQ